MANNATENPSVFWRNALADLHTWKRGGQRAVHKPLLSLLLIARAISGGSNQIHFTEIESQLETLLREFGPTRKSYHPEFPFWHLQYDRFWHVQGGTELPKRKGSSSPTRTTLRQRDAVGFVPDYLWHVLTEDAALRTDLTHKLLSSFWPETRHKVIRRAIGLPDETEAGARSAVPRDPRFRNDVLRAYERRCAICGYDGRLADSLLGLEAAHVRWRAYDGPDDLTNGVALCAFHHMALDAGALSLSDDLTILVSSEVTGQTQVDELLRNYTSRPLRHPQPSSPAPDLRFIKWHRKEVFRHPARDFTYRPRMDVPRAADRAKT